MVVVFFAILILCIVLYGLSKGKYAASITPLEIKEYSFKNYLPMGLYLLDAIQYPYKTRYDQKLLMQVAEIKGHKYAPYYLQIHMANKIVFLLFGILILALFGIGIGTSTDYLIFSLILISLIFYLTDHDLFQKVKKRRMALQMDFPYFINKLTLLINAGMTVVRAWEKITLDSKNKKSPLYEELEITLTEILSGRSEIQAYENFSKRCKILEISKFVSLITQNLRKGNTELVYALQYQAKECWEMRKNTAKKLGEEASSKLLFPMMLMFVAILIIIGVPAVLAIQG